MRLAGQAGAVHPVFVDGARGGGQDAGHAAGHQEVALQSEMVPCVDGSPV